MTRINNRVFGIVLYLLLLQISALRADASIRFTDDPPGITAACITAVSGSTISATAVGTNNTTGFQTRYVLTNSSGVIQSVNTTGTFTAPATAGEYRIYAVNYDGTTAQQPTLTNGTNISAIGGDCVDVSDTPKCFNVVSGNVSCTEVNSGAAISATATGHNTAAGFATRYVLTTAAGVILNSNTTGAFTAPVLSGEVRIYAVNYATTGAQPVFTAGSNISAIGGDCVDVSAVPKCFNVTICEQPTLTVGGNAECTSGGWSFTVSSNGTIQLPSGVTMTGNTVQVPASMAQVAVHASNACGEASETISVSRPTCPAPVVCQTPVTLSVGTPVTYCTGSNGFYSVSFSSNGTVTASAGTLGANSVTNIPIGTTLTLTATIADCSDRVIVINSPAAFTCPVNICDAVNPGISYSLACNTNGTYSINYVTSPGVTVSSSTGSFANLTGNVTLTVTKDACNTSKQIQIIAPQCVVCQQPVLSVGSDIACTTTGWSFTVNSNGIVQVPAGATLVGNTVNVPASMTQVAVHASNSCGETSETISITKPTCPVPATCVTPITLNVGTPVTSCTGTSATYSVSFSSNGTVTASAGTVQGNAVINIPVGTAVTLTASNATCPSQVITVNSPASFTCPVVDPCNDKNPGISYSLTCNANGTYSINYTANAGTVVTSSANGFTNLTGNVTLTITEAGCTVAKTVQITAPQCVTCQQPVLSVGSDIACTTTGWSFTVNSNGTVQVPAGATLVGNTVNVPASMTQVAVHASNACGETSETISITKPTCPVPPACVTPITLNAGTPVTSCTGTSATYSVSFSSNGTVTASAGTVQGNAVINIPVGTAVTLTASNATCPSQVITVNSPASFTCPVVDPCNDKNPGISYSLACNANGTYSINYTANAGTVVTSSAGGFTNLTGNVTLTITEAGCTIAKTIAITAPQCVVCQQPLLSVGSDIACTTTGWSFTVNSNGTVQVPAGVTLTGNTVNVPASMAQVAVHASNACGETSETISITKPTCPVPPACVTPITLNAGTPVTSCTGTSATYSVSFSSNGTVTASAGTVQGNAVINIPVGTAVTLTASNATCPSQVITVNSPASFTCPVVDPCNDKNPGISYSLACNANGTYSITYTANAGTVVTSSAGGFTNLTGNVTLTVTEAGCTIAKTVQITAPQCVICQQPLLSVGSNIACTTTGWSFTVNSNGTVQVPAGVTRTGNTVNVPASMTQVAVHASNACGETSETISITKPTCPVPATCVTPLTLNAGTPVTSCTGTSATYSVSFSSNGTVTASAGTVQGNAVINIPVGTAVTLTASNATCPSQVITVNSPASFTCPVVDPCNDKNPGISYSLACNANGTYTINYTANAGTVVTSSANSFTNLTGNVTLAITEAGCTVAKMVQITAPQCVVCQQPILSVGSDIACTATGWSFTVNSNGTVQVPAGATLVGNTVNVPASMTQVAVHASNACGETSETISITKPICPVPATCETPITLNAGTPVTSCTGTSATYSVSFSSNGTVTASAGTVQGNAVINIPVGTAVTLTASNATCPSQVITVNSPASFTCPVVDPCNDKNPGISYSLACNANGTYSISYTANAGTVVTSSAGGFTNLTGNITLTITEAGCTIAKTVQITAPQCVVCQQPLLSVGSDIACTTTGWSFTVNSNGTVQVPAGVTLTGNTVNVPSTMTQVAVHASNACGETSETISITKPTCPVPATCVTPITLNAGTPVTSCTGTSATYSVSFSSNGTVTASAGTVQGNSVINIPVGTTVTLTASNATCPSQVITVNSPTSFTCPVVDPCNDKNPGISYSLACNANGTYTINYTANAGTVVTSSANSFTNLTGNVTLTITEAGCTIAKTIAITAPQCEIAGDIALVKTGVFNATDGTITYTFRVTNTGQIALSNIAITDPKLGGPVVLNTTTLAPGASAEGTAVYTITEVDRTNGSVTNTATVTGTTPGGTTVSDTSGETTDDDRPTVITVPKCPQGVKCLTVKVTKNK